MKTTTIAMLGLGTRGGMAAELTKSPQLFTKIVAVADPNPIHRQSAQEQYQLPNDRVFETAEELLAQPRMADAVVNTTMDRLHASTSIPAMEKGYHLLLEKPMAVTEDDCRAIEATQQKTGRVVGVWHSMRYHKAYATAKAMLDSGTIGDLVSFDGMEGVNDIHFSHSYCRGNWRNEESSCFILMTKSCHDIDLFHYFTGRNCTKVSSFGKLSYFNKENKPKSAPKMCMDGCPEEANCPYHAAKVYLEITQWRCVFPKQDEESIINYLKTGPYGRCVFDCDNDVVDHQVVAMEFDEGITGTFTMTAFHPGNRFLRLHGTKGFMQLGVAHNTITHSDFISGNTTTIVVPEILGEHGGADYLILKGFIDAVRKEDPSAVLATAQESLESHLTVFAAERSRKEGRMITL